MAGIVAAAVPAVVSGLASLFGGHSANRTNIKLARERMGFEHAEAGRQMEFQERMSSTAYQRAMQDMRSAGLNPMLAYMQGGASSPSGAAGAGAQAEVSDVVSPAVSSAMNAIMMRKQMRVLDEEKRLKVEQQWNALQDRAESRSREDLNVAQADNERQTLLALKAQLPALLNSAKVENSWVGPTAAYFDRVLRALSPIAGVGVGALLRGAIPPKKAR